MNIGERPMQSNEELIFQDKHLSLRTDDAQICSQRGISVTFVAYVEFRLNGGGLGWHTAMEFFLGSSTNLSLLSLTLTRVAEESEEPVGRRRPTWGGDCRDFRHHPSASSLLFSPIRKSEHRRGAARKLMKDRKRGSMSKRIHLASGIGWFLEDVY